MKIMKFDFWNYVSFGILGMVGSAGTILTDAYFVSDRLGAIGLAAMNISMCMFGLMNGTGLLFGIGGATRYTIRKVKGHDKGANQSFVLSFFAALMIGIIYAVIGLLFSEQISYMLGANSETIEMCNVYLKTILLFAPAFVINHLLMAFAAMLVRCFNGDGNTILQELAEDGLKLYFIGFLFVGYNYLTTSFFSATEKPKQSFVVAIFRGFIGIIAVAVILSGYWGMTGIWLAFSSVEIITIGICMILKSRYKQKKPRISVSRERYDNLKTTLPIPKKNIANH